MKQNITLRGVANAVYDLSIVLADLIEYGGVALDQSQANDRIMNARVLCFDPAQPQENIERAENSGGVAGGQGTANKQSTPCKHRYVIKDNPVPGAQVCVSCGEQV